MATKKTVTLVDDLDGSSTAAETVTFNLDGVDYEIDLTVKHAKQIRSEFKPWVEAGRRTGGRRRTAASAASTPREVEPAALRQWARENGYEVSPRGRVPDIIVAAHAAAHNS